MVSAVERVRTRIAKQNENIDGVRDCRQHARDVLVDLLRRQTSPEQEVEVGCMTNGEKEAIHVEKQDGTGEVWLAETTSAPGCLLIEGDC